MVMSKCPFCGILYPLEVSNGETRHDLNEGGCLVNPIEQALKTCYTCGVREGMGRTGKKVKSRFTPTERARGNRARCKTCVSKGIWKRHEAFSCRDDSLGEQLYQNIRYPDPEKIYTLLNAGANPNHVRQVTVRDPAISKFVWAWNDDYTPIPDMEPGQPTKPLLSIDFSMEDLMYTMKDHENAALSAQHLIDAGAYVLGEEYRYVSFDERYNDDWLPERKVIWKAGKSLLWILDQCHKKAATGSAFDFQGYLSQRKVLPHLMACRS